MQCWRLYQQSYFPVRKASGSSSIKRKYIWHSAGLWQKGRAGKRALGLTYGKLREMSKAQYKRAGEGEHCVTDSQKITAPGSQGHTDSFFPNSLTHFLLGMTSFIISCLCLCYNLNVLDPIAFSRGQEPRNPSWCPENPFHASNTALDVRWPPKPCKPVSLKSSQQLTHPQPKGRADAFPNASPASPLPELQPWDTLLKCLIHKQTTSGLISLSTLKREKEEKNVPNLISPLTRLPLTCL